MSNVRYQNEASPASLDVKDVDMTSRVKKISFVGIAGVAGEHLT
jgi:hypothetical protein